MNTHAIDNVLAGAVRSGQVPGLVAMAADRDGVLYQGAFGRRGLDDPTPMALETVFWIASMTKAITSVAAMQLVQAGRLPLDAPLGDWAPWLAAPPVLEGFDAAGAPRLRPAAGAPTLRQLLTHTAGFSYNMWNADVARWMAQSGLPPAREGRVASLNQPLIFDPGTRWEYGINTDWVGRVVEAEASASLPEVFAAKIFAPLGMTDSAFVPTAAMRERRAAVHSRGADGSLRTVPWNLPETPEFFGGGGGLLSTAPDYLRFARMLLRGGELDGVHVLAEATVAEMGRNQSGELAMRPMVSAVPSLTNTFEPWPGMVKRWGLGFMINTQDVPGGRAAGSLAWAGLGNCYYWVDPTRGVTGLLLSQVLPFGDPAVLQVFEAFERAVYA